MKSGCGCGCLTLVLLGVLAVALLWLGSGILDTPPVHRETGTAADGRRAQQKLFELTSGRSGRRDDRKTITLSEGELNAFLARHFSPGEAPLTDVGVRLVGDGVVEVAGRLPLPTLLGDWLGAIVGFLPDRWIATPVWFRLGGPVRVETGAAPTDRRRLRLDVQYLMLGQRRLPAALLSVLPEGPVQRATRWAVADRLDAVIVEPGTVTLIVRP